MFGLIGHSTSFKDARQKAMDLGYDHIAEGDLDVWCSAPPQLVEHVEIVSENVRLELPFDPVLIEKLLPKLSAKYKSIPKKRVDQAITSIFLK